MPSFSESSKAKLEDCHKDLQCLFNEVIHGFDCAILTGYRDMEEQNQKYDEGKSMVRWPDGRHNKYPSIAVDAAPYPLKFKEWDAEWRERAQLYFFGGYVMGVAEKLGLKLRWGGDWDGDGCYRDQAFDDLFHFELVA